MSANHPQSSKTTPPPEQITYANLLFYGCWLAILLMVITYFIYLSGLLSPHVPTHQLEQLWRQSVHHYVQNSNIPYGWGWVSLITKGDFLNFIGIVLLAGMTVISFLTLIPPYLKKKDFIYFAIVLAEVLILLLAASGLLVVGGH